ncbi:MAG TPA: anti-sigma factor [Solirubrobacterales bacterium]|jgi:anti-sigma-K factor RskA|nr:anti-sigma factor [Solirubrobacterales bacterium]
MNASDHNRWSEDLAAFVLGALEREEASAFERHLEGCERCQEEMRWLQPALGTLPESVERTEPPPQLRESLMAEVRADARAARAPERQARSRSWGWLLKPAAGLALVALLVAGVVGYEVGKDDGSSGGGASTLERQIDGISVRMVQEGDGGTLQLSNLHQLPEDKVLEAWVEREGQVEAVPALFVPDRHGHAETTIADMSGVETVMVTEEPRGGSEAPTGEPIMSMAVPQ